MEGQGLLDLPWRVELHVEYEMQVNLVRGVCGVEVAGGRAAGILSRLALVSLAVAASVSGIAALGWVLGLLLFATISASFIPMAPSTASMFLLISIAGLVYCRWPTRPRLRVLIQLCALVSLSLCLIVLIEFLTGVSLDIESLFLRQPSLFGQVPIGRMSPITAVNFLLAGISLLSLVSTNRRWMNRAGALGAAVASVGFVIVVGYLFGAPLLYGSTIIPVALTTAIAFVFLGIGLCASGGPACWPVSALVGSAVRARLLRAFLPVTIVIILAYGWFNTAVASRMGNPALITSLALFLSLGVVSVVVSRMARNVGNEIEHATAERERALSELQAALAEVRERDETIRRLSTPLVEIAEGVVMLPLIGTVDSDRAKQVTDTILGHLEKTKNRVALIDLSGIAAIDTKTANYILHTVRSVKLMGSDVIITGIRPDVATTIVSLGIDLSEITTRSTLREGLEQALTKPK